MRWPKGPHCPKCGVDRPYSITRKSRTKNKVQSLYKCRDCKRQFSATVGTIFEDSKIPLHKWFAGIFLMCSSKKGISAHQLHRMLGITYKSAWFMCHRVRQATRDKEFPMLSGVVEADETYMGGRTRRGHKVHHERIRDEIEMGLRPKPARRPPYQEKTTVFGMVECEGRRDNVPPGRVERWGVAFENCTAYRLQLGSNEPDGR
jgi:transposase-like protein